MRFWTIVGAVAVTAAVAGTAAASPPKRGVAAYRACLRAHGVSFGSSTKAPSAAKLRAAAHACASVAPGGTTFGARRSPAFRKYAACLSKHGVAFRRGTRPAAAKLTAARKACASLAPKGGFRFGGSPAFRRYTQCLAKHGVTFTFAARANRSSARFKAAAKACAPLRPKRPARNA